MTGVQTCALPISSGYLGITNSTNGDIFYINSSGNARLTGSLGIGEIGRASCRERV